MAYQKIHYAVADGIALIEVSDPPANTYSYEMMREIDAAVLDARMRVRGIEGLRVADMSACPNINAGNTTAPALMLGSRCADFVMGLE